VWMEGVRCALRETRPSGVGRPGEEGRRLKPDGEFGGVKTGRPGKEKRPQILRRGGGGLSQPEKLDDSSVVWDRAPRFPVLSLFRQGCRTITDPTPDTSRQRSAKLTVHTVHPDARVGLAARSAELRRSVYFARVTSILAFAVWPSRTMFTSQVIRSAARTRSKVILRSSSSTSSVILSPSIFPLVMACCSPSSGLAPVPTSRSGGRSGA
jgi:hypothetical protein